MADTIINTPSPNNSDSSAGWVVALVVILAVVVGGIVLYQKGYFAAPSQPDTTNINVTIPTPGADSNDQTQ